jgi:hypothetical protein
MTQTSPPADPRPLTRTEVESGDRRDPWVLERYPILIGVSGKRMFDKTDVAADAAVADSIAKRFRAVFEALDRDLPETPKIVVTGAAFGTDLIAAETALGMGRQWAVAAVLPFDRALFEEDFQPAPGEEGWRDRYASHLRTFERVLGPPDDPNPRVLVRELPKLSVGGGAATAQLLSRHGTKPDKTLRHNHYEQVGQLIAEISTIMIAVMDGEEQPDQSEANGGTARIVACRRAGCPDAVGTAVARRSRVLRGEWPEVKPLPAGHVWLMDPQKSDRTGRYPVKVLPPLLDRCADDIYGGHPGADLTEERPTPVGPLTRVANALNAVAARLRGADLEAPARSRRLRASLAVARGFERYHRDGSRALSLMNAKPVADASPIAHLADALNAARSNFSTRQRKVNSYVKLGFYALAIFFVLAVTIFELSTQLLHDSPGLLFAYLVVLAAIGIMALLERWKLWEAVAEDYRAVAEMLRVQRAWWSAGSTARVDREHLQGVDQDLAPIRDCAKTVIAWILLRHGWKEPVRDWTHVRGTSVKPRNLRGTNKPPGDWIGSQLWYFINSQDIRETSVHRIDAESWSLFVISGILAAVLWTWLAFPKVMSMSEQMAHIGLPASWQLPAWASFIRFDISPIVWFLLAVLAFGFRVVNHDIRRGLAAILFTGVMGALAAFGLALALISAGPGIAHLTSPKDLDIAHAISAQDIEDIDRAIEFAVRYAMVAVLVVLSASAGALRYLMERLNIEAEALEYRDALGRFERAERRLARGSDPKTGMPADEKAARHIVYELGCLALAENEAWLKSRRERPLTPLVG